MKRLKHLPHIICCGLISFLLLPWIIPFAGPSTGYVIRGVLLSMVVTHAIGLGIGLYYVRITFVSSLIVCTACLMPVGVLAYGSVQDHIYLKYYAASDRFRDELLDPIPVSVNNLSFVPLEQSIETHLMLRFEIDPTDLDRIIHTYGYKEVEGEFRRPDDYFTCENYLPLEGKARFYQAIDEGDEGYTLKVSGDRRTVIFRRESASYYHYRYWENGHNQQRQAEVFGRLGCQ